MMKAGWRHWEVLSIHRYDHWQEVCLAAKEQLETPRLFEASLFGISHLGFQSFEVG